MSDSAGDIVKSEADFHDAWAESTPLEELFVREHFEAPTAPEFRFMLALMGDLNGKKVLDVGCGLGEASVYFALSGAQSIAADISSGMLEKAKALAKTHGTNIETCLLDGKTLSQPTSSIDIVFAANIVHHLQDRMPFYREAQRVLKPGGLYVAVDPLAYNPIINIYRRMAEGVRTVDEEPLTRKDFNEIRAVFPDAGHREFWFLSNLLFVKYWLIDRHHPSKVRYWKRRFDISTVGLWWFLPVAFLDSILLRIPGLSLLAWNTVVWGRK